MNAKASVALCAALFCGLCAWRATQPHDIDPITRERTINVLRLMRSLVRDCKVSEEQLEAAINTSLPCLKREMARVSPVKLNNTLDHFEVMQECVKSDETNHEADRSADQYHDSCFKYLPDMSNEADVEIAKIFEKCLPGSVFSSVWQDTSMPGQHSDTTVATTTSDGVDRNYNPNTNQAPRTD